MNIETENVKNVYEKIAKHFDKTRFKVWPSVEKFIDKIPKDSLVLDVGCGNCKNMYRQDVYFIGSDFCQNFASICRNNNKNVFMANSKILPIKDNSMDDVICIAMLHHIYSEIHRIQCIHEIYRVLKMGGKMLITVWAQGNKPEQDNMIPWKIQKKHKISENEPEVYQRYYHLFSENELLNIIKNNFDQKLIVKEYYNDYGNWIIECVKTK